jgi:hypothetical protein
MRTCDYGLAREFSYVNSIQVLILHRSFRIGMFAELPDTVGLRFVRPMMPPVAVPPMRKYTLERQLKEYSINPNTPDKTTARSSSVDFIIKVSCCIK